MNEELKLRPSVGVIITRVISLVLVAVAVVCAYLGFVDPRTEEEKAEQYRLSVVASASGEYAIEALCYASRNDTFESYEYISVLLRADKKYVKIVGRGHEGKHVDFCYDANKKREIDSILFDSIIAANSAQANFVGKEPQKISITYKDEELNMLLEEAGVWH